MRNTRKFICNIFKQRKESLKKLQDAGTPLCYWMATPAIDYTKFAR